MIEWIQHGPDDCDLPGRGTKEINEERLAEAFGEPYPRPLSNYDEVKGESWLCQPVKIDYFPKWVPLQEMRAKQDQPLISQQASKSENDENSIKLKV